MYPYFSGVSNWRQSSELSEFQLILFPYKRRIYGMYFGETYAKEWRSLEAVGEFGYWNNTDRPEGISARGWGQRRKIWDEILGWDAPSMRGFQAQIVEKHPPPPDLKTVLGFIPSLEERAHLFGIENLYKEGVPGVGEDNWEQYKLFREWLHSEEGREKLRGEKIKIQEKLIPEITPEMLLGEFEMTGKERILNQETPQQESPA